MTRIAIGAASPLVADGIASALAPTWLAEVVGAPSAMAALLARGGHDALVAQARDAAEALSLLAALPPALPAVLLTDAGRDLAARGEARPLALLGTDATPAQLRAALAAVLQGLSVREPALPWPPPAAPGEHEPLTPRELEVFELLGKGLSNRDIAGVLGISAHTAKFHVGQILAKVGAATRAEAVSAGLRLGLIGL